MITPNCCLFNGRTAIIQGSKTNKGRPREIFFCPPRLSPSPLHRRRIIPLFFVLLLPLLHSVSSIFSSLSFFPYPFPFSPPYFLHVLTESTARTRRHTRLFSSVSILISRARNSRTLRSLGVLKGNAGISRAFAAHLTGPLPPWRPVAWPTQAAFISAAMKETHFHRF